MQKIIILEDSEPLKTNMVEINIRQSQLKNISKTKDELMSRLEKINQKIELLLEEEKFRQKNYRPNLTEIGEDDNEEEKFNLQLVKMQKEEEKIRKK